MAEGRAGRYERSGRLAQSAGTGRMAAPAGPSRLMRLVDQWRRETASTGEAEAVLVITLIIRCSGRCVRACRLPQLSLVHEDRKYRKLRPEKVHAFESWQVSTIISAFLIFEMTTSRAIRSQPSTRLLRSRHATAQNSHLLCKSVDQPLRCRTWRRLDSPNRLERIQRILHAMDIQLNEPSCVQVAADHEFRHQAPTDRGQ